MAGSYKHIVNSDGSFRGTHLLDHMGDAFEALQECYDMIQWLSERLVKASGGVHSRSEVIASASVLGHLVKVRRDLRRRELEQAIEEYWT